MSKTIDERVVEMQFDNKHFEKNVATSMNTIDKLKSNLSGIGGSAEKIGLRFNAMYTIADQALRNITDSAMAAGKRIVSALTIDPIRTGLSEYETQMGAIQTILANTESKGSTLEDVNNALGELNTYADKTIYNFTQMTRNIGTFTAAGVDLDTSVNAIKGIANLAAVSGSTSQQASVAMYQLSQALSSGTVKLMDWNSVVNAGMGGQVFQDALKETARVQGIAIDDLIKKHGSFRETLQEGWLTSKVLLDTLEKFTMTTQGLTDEEIEANRERLKSKGYTDAQIDAIFKLGNTATGAATEVKTLTQLWDTLQETAQSGWTQTWEIIMGDFEEAKKLFSGVYNTIAPMVEAMSASRNELLENWKVMGGRDDLMAAIKNTFEGVLSIIKPIKEAFRDIFPPMTAEKLVALSEGLKNFTAKLKLSDKSSADLKRTFKGLFGILSIVTEAFKAVFKAIGTLLGGVGGIGESILSVTGYFGDWLGRLAEAIKATDIFDRVLQTIAKTIKAAFGGLKNLATALKDTFIIPGIDACRSALERIQELMSGVSNAATNMKNGVTNAFNGMSTATKDNFFVTLLEGLGKALTVIGTVIGKVIGAIGGALAGLFSGGSFSGLLDLLNTLIAGGVGFGVFKLLKGLGDIIDGCSDIVENFSGIVEGLGDCLQGFSQKLKAEALKKIATAILILAGALLILSFIDEDKMSTAIAAVTMLFAELLGSMAIFTRISKGGFTGVTKACTAMISISLAVLILASALKKIADLEMSELATGLLGVAGLMAIVLAAVKVLSSGGKKAIKGATQMILFAAAVKILASACVDLAWLSWEELAKGLVGVGVLMTEISLFLRTAKFSGKAITTATGIVILAAAIKILASACQDFGQMAWGEIGKGLTAIGLLLAEIAIFTQLTKGAKNVLSTGIAMIAIAAAMKIFASAAHDIAELSWEEIAKGLVAMAGALAAIVIAVNLMPKNMLSKAVSLLAITSALVILSTALNKMGSMSWGSVAKGLVALGGSLVIIAVGLHAMKGTLGGTVALVAATAALALLTPVLAILGALSWTSIVKGLVAIAGAFVIIGVAGYALAPVVPAILGLAASLTLIGVAILAAGAGVAAFGVGVSLLAAGLLVLVSSLGAVAKGLVEIVEAIVVGIIKGLGNGIVALLEVIADLAPAISEALIALVVMLCDVLVECAPVLARTVLELLVQAIEICAEFAPKIVTALVKLIVGLIDALGEGIPEIIKAVFRFIDSLFTGIINALGAMDFSSLMKGLAGVGLMAALVAALAAITPLIPSAMVGALGVAAVVAEMAVILAAIGALAQIPGVNWLIESAGDFLEKIGTAIGQFIGGIVGGIGKGITSALPEMGQDLSNFMTNAKRFIEGARMVDNSVLDGVTTLVATILALTGANILNRLTSWFSGGSSLTKFGNDIAKFGPKMREYANAVSGIDSSAVEASANAGKALSEMAANLPNSGGLASWFTGDNTLKKFGKHLSQFGEAMREYSVSVTGIDTHSIVNSTNAARALADMTNCIPNSGGLLAWISGDNSVSKFAFDIVKLGNGIKGFSEATSGIVADNVIAAANAAKALADMTSYIPNSGGITAWFAGDNSVAKFASDIVGLGYGLRGFSDATVGIVPDNITAAANAAKALADMTNCIPNSGGVVSWFTGDNSLSKFSEDIVKLGQGLSGFSVATMGVVPDTITAAANAAKTIAEMTNVIPNSGGVVSWFAGDNSLSKFSTDIVSLGQGIAAFSVATTGVMPDTVAAAANAAKILAEMTNSIPNEGGVVSWFTGEYSLSKFSGELASLGTGLKSFSDNTTGIVPESVVAAANAAKTLAEMTEHLPNEGGVVSWFAGESSMAHFADQLPKLGAGLKGFSDSVVGTNSENISAAANAAKALAEMTNVIPKEGGIKAWFTGESNIVSFAGKLPELGTGLKGFSDSVAGISPENVTAAANAGKALADMANTVPKNTDHVHKFGTNLAKFGEKLMAYFSNTTGITAEAISISSSAIDAVKKVSEINANGITDVASALKELTKAVSNMVKDIKSDLKDAGKEAIEGYVKGLNEGISKVESACSDLVSACAEKIKSKSGSFTTAGGHLVDGFASGITANTYKAEAKAKAMAEAAAQAARDALAINSPSKVFRAIGTSIPEGFAMGIEKLGGMVKNASTSMGDTAVSGVKRSISRLADVVNGDIDTQPTIRPVLDLSDVRSGVGAISSMFGSGASVDVLANVGAIGSMMNNRNQNGGIDDMVSAIDKLRKDLSGMEHATYNINGITYDDGSNIADAVQTLVRAAKIERRT